MYKYTRFKWPKGAYVELQSREVLRALMNQNDLSNRSLARVAGVSHATVDHLLRLGPSARKGCGTASAEKIARALKVPVTVLFTVKVQESAEPVRPTRRQAVAA